MHNYEIEIKVLLGNESEKDNFMSKVQKSFPDMRHSYSESQKNHYFEWGSLEWLLSAFGPKVTHAERAKLENIRDTAKSFSVRTRGTPTQTIIVVKATVNDESSSNGTVRIEWEVDLASMTLEDMDTNVLSAGFVYQAKWSREREWYMFKAPNKGFMYELLTESQNEIQYDSTTSVTLCLDKNAGYWYLAEFEMVIEDAEKVENVRKFLLSIIESLGYHELDQARLSRMFDFYNKNWREYYGTEKVFTIL